MVQLWNVSQQDVRYHCNKEKIPGVIRVGKNRIYIPINSKKPLTESQIKRLLFLVLQLKNNPKFEIDWNALELKQNEVYETYKTLEQLGYVKHFETKGKMSDSDIPYIAELTEKGMEFTFSQNKKKQIDWKGLFISIVPCVFELGVQYVSSKIKN